MRLSGDRKNHGNRLIATRPGEGRHGIRAPIRHQTSNSDLGPYRLGRPLSSRDRLGIQLVLGAAATSGRDRKVAYVANFVSGVTIDCVDPQRVARFWSALLGREPGLSQAGWVYLGHRGDPQPRLVFQPVPEPKAGKVRIHLDVTVDDVDEAIELVTSLGGRTTDERHNYDEGVVVVMADPEGHEFCLVQYN